MTPIPILTLGDEFVELEVVFQPIDKLAANDAWVTVNTLEIESGGEEIKLEISRYSQRMAKEADGRACLSLGQIKRGELAKIEAGLGLRLGFQIAYSEQVESGRLDLREGSGYAAGGNRLVVRNIYRYKDRLSVELAGVIPQYGAEPHQGSVWGEAFNGQFTFALARKDGTGAPLDFRISGFPNPMRRVLTSTLERTLAESENRADYEIIVYSRTVTGNDFEFVTADDVKLVRP